MEITLRNHKIVLKVGMERTQDSHKEAGLSEKVKRQQILAAIEKEREYAINRLYLS